MSECLLQDLDSVRAERDNRAAEAQSLQLSLEQLQTKLQVGRQAHLLRLQESKLHSEAPFQLLLAL